MKKSLFLAVFSMMLIPSLTFASFDRNLKYGMSGNDVSDLQDILTENGCFTHSSTGYFGLLTLDAVKCWQTKNSLPSTGYFGILSRGIANQIVVDAVASSTEAEIQETGTTTQPSSNIQIPINAGASSPVVNQQTVQQPIQKNLLNNPVSVLSISQPPDPDICLYTDGKGHYGRDQYYLQNGADYSLGVVRFDTNKDSSGIPIIVNYTVTTTASSSIENPNKDPRADKFVSNIGSINADASSGIEQTEMLNGNKIAHLKTSGSIYFMAKSIIQENTTSITVNSITDSNGNQISGLPVTLNPVNLRLCQ